MCPGCVLWPGNGGWLDLLLQCCPSQDGQPDGPGGPHPAGFRPGLLDGQALLCREHCWLPGWRDSQPGGFLYFQNFSQKIVARKSFLASAPLAAETWILTAASQSLWVILAARYVHSKFPFKTPAGSLLAFSMESSRQMERSTSRK